VPLERKIGGNKERGDNQMEPTAKELHIEALIQEELERIIEEHGLFVDDHQAYAVIREEVEEAEDEIIILKESMDELWKRVRNDDLDNLDIMESLQLHGIELIKEGVQVVACARKYDRGHLKQWIEKRAEKV